MFLVTAVALLVVNHTGLNAREFRGFTGISGVQQDISSDVPKGCVDVGSIVPISRENVTAVMDALAAAWNGTGFSDLLTDEFTSKEQLLQVMTDEVPRDAILTILSVQSSQTFQQCEIIRFAGGRDRLSIVVVVARTQIEFTDPDPDIGFQSIEGTNEYYFLFTEKL